MAEELPEFDFELAEREQNPHGVKKVYSPANLDRRVMWDIIPCSKVAEVAARRGLPPASEDVMESEHAAHHERVEAIRHLYPVLHDFSVYSAQAVQAGIMVDNGVKFDDEATQTFFRQMVPLIFQSMVTALAELNDIGLIHTTTSHTYGGS